MAFPDSDSERVHFSWFLFHACSQPLTITGSGTGVALERRVVLHTWDRQADGTAERTTV